MSAHLHDFIHSMRFVEFVYALVLMALLLGLFRGRASRRTFLASPLYALIVMVCATALIALLNFVPYFDGETLPPVGLKIVLFVWLAYSAGRWLAKGEVSAAPAHLRGAIVSAARPRSVPHAACVTLAGIPIPPADETKHFKLIGTTGTGKSTAIREMLSAALARGDRAIIADPDGGYLARFYDAARGDVILNPFDGDARKWDLFAEITNDYDVEQLARSLIPDSGDPDRTWSEYARTFFSAVTQQAIAADARNDSELYRLLTSAPAEELRVLLAGTAAGPFLEAGNEKMFGSVRSITSSAVRALKYTTRQEAPPFSVRQWVRQGAGKGGALFIPYKAGEIAALRSMISAWMRIAIFEAMDRDEADQRLWFVIDELDALGEIDGLKDALARLRKFGGRCILGFQSISQVSGTYGKGVAETIVENCGNTLILRCSASEHGGTSEFASKLIGQREVMHTTRSRTRKPTDWIASTTSSEHLKIEPAIMASQIERLPDLEGFLKLASVPDWQTVRLAPMSEPATVRMRKPVIVASPPTAVAPVAGASRTRRAKPAPRRAPTPRQPAAPENAVVPEVETGRVAPVESRPTGAE